MRAGVIYHLGLRLRELDKGVLEKRQIDSLTEEEEGWRRQLVNGTQDGRTPGGGIDAGVGLTFMPRWRPVWSARRAADLYWSSRYRVGLSGQYYIGTTRPAERRLRLRNRSTSRIDYQKVSGWRLGGVVETAGTPHLTPLH